MNAAPPRLGIERIARPRSVAVIGASEDARKFGGRVLRNVLHHRFAGRVVPINPNRPSLLGLPAFPSLKDARDPVDVAIIAVPQPLLEASLADCVAAGTGAAVIITSQFAEVGPEGAALQDRVVATARAAGMRLIGPNCLGYISPVASLALNSSPAMEGSTLEPGPIGLVSQSGALMATIYNRAVEDGARFSLAVSVGNQADLEAMDFVEFLVGDAATRVICLYAEGFKDPARFAAAARAARAAGKPMLMVKAGRTEAGVAVARSHTASLAGAYPSLRAVAEDYGVVLMDDLDAMTRAAHLATTDLERAGGGGIGVVSPSGGAAAIVADRLTGAGHRLANLGAATREGLGRLYMPNQVGNPLDLGGRREGEYSAIARDTMTTLAAEPDVAAFLVVLTTAPMLDEIAAGLAAPAVATGKPTLFVVLPGTAGDAARRAVAAHGLLCVDTIDEALRVLDGWRAVGAAAPVAPAPSRPAGLPVTHPPTDRTGALTEPEAKALLAACGIALPAERVAADADGAAAAARAIGYPVVAKAIKRSLSHKSDAGGVALNLADETALRAAIAAMARLEPEAYLIAAMARGEAELILGLNHDPQFGPMVLAGFGGIHAELLADTALAPAPVSPARAEAMLRGLRLWPLLDGARGRPKLDVAAVVDALVRLSWLGHDLGPRLVELDVNPLIVGVKGVWALDARAMLA
ncbi:MAG: CoA-binding protein [Alphaproteobacteria bacterium]|nr:CoA-binding protein [Alphaproteobacteria bacterium]